jgi:hypothetical protein
MGVQRKHVNELCNERRSVTARPLILASFRQRPILVECQRGRLWKAMRGVGDRISGRSSEQSGVNQPHDLVSRCMEMEFEWSTGAAAHSPDFVTKGNAT